jgi:SAM-dependent methyltransferase
LHHVGDPARAVVEMVRVARSDGRIVLSDLIAPSAVDREAFDALHQRIDPSHRRAFLEAELVDLLPDDCTLTYGATASSRLPVDIAFTEQSDRDGVLDTLRAEVAGGPATGFEPSEEDGTMVVSFWTSTVHATWPADRAHR